jgi:two-component system, OmpR family, response regulator
MVRSPAHILVVEDDTLVAEVVVEALEPTYQTTHADTCAGALASLRKGGIDAILLDCTLPDGVDPALLAEADEAGVAVVVMSGHPELAERIAGAKRTFLLKPFLLDALLDAVERAVPGQAAAA